ncbi:RNA-binding domain-containing protein [Chitinophaga sp. sic0106]|uniref:RNA-binding domain-containing protein n=1 Tax=Chitinophaga sp. sic0106 TaxID=2854785 RepID=UPI001C491DC5|nr:RNA-binding domain-containing protein [Chitinophaga sp. sic0106]MBV7529393.1 putative DNA binding domain-containing protein [Chitinophaga sp. sic0106]
MITENKVKELIAAMESDRVERTRSTADDKLGQAICAFSNDFPNHKLPGYLLLGVDDDGSLAGKNYTDDDLQKIGGMKTNGKILPQPSITVSSIFKFQGGDVIVIEVRPSSYPPVRYDGRCWIRVGPRRDKASVEEERILSEKRVSNAKTYDLVPALSSTIADLSIELFKINYLTSAVDKETLAENGRTTEEQLASLRFYDPREHCPTNAGILMFGLNPEFYLPGAYIQYIKFSGLEMTDAVEYEKKFSGALITELRLLDDFIKGNIIKERPQRTDSFQEINVRNYPYWALRELVMNAIMHRSYESNAPIYIYEFSNRIEIINPGGLFGEATPQNFPDASDYRNVVLAESMKVLGYVNRFNYGVKRAIHELERNENGAPKFDLNLTTKFKVSIPINKNWE